LGKATKEVRNGAFSWGRLYRDPAIGQFVYFDLLAWFNTKVLEQISPQSNLTFGGNCKRGHYGPPSLGCLIVRQIGLTIKKNEGKRFWIVAIGLKIMPTVAGIKKLFGEESPPHKNDKRQDGEAGYDVTFHVRGFLGQAQPGDRADGLAAGGTLGGVQRKIGETLRALFGYMDSGLNICWALPSSGIRHESSQPVRSAKIRNPKCHSGDPLAGIH